MRAGKKREKLPQKNAEPKNKEDDEDGKVVQKIAPPNNREENEARTQAAKITGR